MERILGEGVAPFRDKVVIANKFGWNIDQQTGRRLPGLNSCPEHIKQVVENMLIQRLQQQDVETEFYLFPGVGHGFALGTGTSVEGWLDQAILFWQRMMKN